MQLKYYQRPLFILLILLCGFIFLSKDKYTKTADLPPFNLPRLSVLVEGRIAQYPVNQNRKIRFKLDQVSLYHKPLKSSLMVYAKDIKDYSYGDKIAFLADIHEPEGSYIPGGLNWAEYLFRQGISAEARVVSPVDLLEPAGKFVSFATEFRRRILNSFEKNLSEVQASVLSGIAIGEKRNVPEDLQTAFRNSGAIHLLVASGSNVGFIVVIVYCLCGYFGFRRKLSGFFALVISGFYVLSCGLDMPLVRAYIMFAVGLFAFMLKREAGGFHSLVMAAFIILLFMPRSLFDVGFQMSFFAAYGLTVGMALWTEPLKKFCEVFFNMKNTPRGAKIASFVYKILNLAAISFFAQLFLYPMLANNFHEISLISVVSNIFLVPASGIAMALGFILALFPDFGIVTDIIAAATSVFMNCFIFLVNFFAGFSFSSFTVAEPSITVLSGYYFLAFAVLHWPILGFTKYMFPAIGCFIIMMGPVMNSLGNIKTKERIMLFGDKRTSSAVIVRKNGLYLVNPGLDGKKLADAVLAEGKYTLNAVLFTSISDNNFKGLLELSKKIRIKSILIPYGPMNDDMYASLAPARRSGAKILRVWPEKTGSLRLSWPEQVFGYAGRGEDYDWIINDVKISNNGRCASVYRDKRWSNNDCSDANSKLITEIKL